MKITVITPTWNQASFIEDTLKSVTGQTHRDIEYFIIDNLSDDGTEEIVSKYAAADPRIIYIREADHGQAQAINKGLNRATGDIVCWLNSDDTFYDENVLKRINALFEENKEADIIAGDGWYCNKAMNPERYEECGKKADSADISRWYYIMQPSVFWRKNQLRLDENYHYVFDWKFFAEMFGAHRVIFTNEAYSNYRMYEDNKTGANNWKRKKEIYLLQEELHPGSLNAKWCRYVWQQYERAEKNNKPGLKKRADLFSRVLFHLSGKKVCSF